MQTSELIPLETFCEYHQTEHGFLYSLHQYGLIELLEAADGTYIPQTALPQLEQMLRLHQELELNVAGIDVVIHLLRRVQTMQTETNTLRARLQLYE